MTYIAFIRRRALMLSSSHKPGCMAAIPASQSCRVRRVLCMTDAHSSCVQPAVARRACRASGEKAARCLRRFGWLGILQTHQNCLPFADVVSAVVTDRGDSVRVFDSAGLCNFWRERYMQFEGVRFDPFCAHGANLSADLFSEGGSFRGSSGADEFGGKGLEVLKSSHFDSFAPESRGAVVSDFAGMSELYTRIPCVQLPFVGKFEIV